MFISGFGELSRLGKPLVIAEVGANHQGDLDRAFKSVSGASKAGASAIKFQTRTIDEVYAPSLMDRVTDNPNWFDPHYGTHRSLLEFDEKQWSELFSHCREEGILGFSTHFDHSSVDRLERVGVTMYKIASGDSQNTPLIRHVCSTGMPVIVSTGGCSEEDVDRVVETAYLSGHAGKLVLMQCTCEYPGKPDNQNLLVIKSYLEKYPEEVTIGLSSHNPNWWVNIAAYALGARVFENHFTLDRTWKGTDQAFSLDVPAMKEYTTALDETARAMGVPAKMADPDEWTYTLERRKAMYASRDIPEGKAVEQSDMIALSPGGGISPFQASIIEGKTVSKTLKKGDMITIDKLNSVPLIDTYKYDASGTKLLYKWNS